MGLISRVSSRTYRDVSNSFINSKSVVETKNPTEANMAHADTVKKIMAIKESNPGNIAIASFDEAEFAGMSEADQSRLVKIMASGIGNPGSEMGCYAMNPTDYDDFHTFFSKALGRYHKVNLDEKKHQNDWELKGKAGLPADGVLDVSKFGITEPLSMRIRTARNLKKFPLAGAMTEEDRKNMELAMGPVFEALIKNPEFGGSYNSLTPGHACHISEEKYQELVKAHIMFKDMSADSFLVDAGIAAHWPHGRGCYVSEDKGFIIWVGEEDHLRIMAMAKSLKINSVFDRLKAAIDKVEDLNPGGCAKSADFGVITSCPTNMGTGMRASVHIKIPNLTKGGSDEKPSPSLSHTTWESEDSVVNTPQSVPTEPSISRQKVDSVSPKPRSPLLCTLVSTRSCKKNPKHKFV